MMTLSKYEKLKILSF